MPEASTPHIPEVDGEFVDTASRPETRGIELIGDAKRHGKARELVAVWAAPSVSIINFTVGASMIVMGLTIWQSVLVIALGNLPWIFVGLIAASGTAAGTSGSVIMRAMYGIVGNKIIVAFIGWLVAAVYLALNALAAAFMGADLLNNLGWHDPVLVPIVMTVVVVAVTVIIAVYGHALILRAYTVLMIVLGVVFFIVTGFIVSHVDWAYQPAQSLHGVELWSTVSIAFAILASTPLSYINSPDMARYLPRSTKPSHIAAATALGGALPTFFFTVVGALMATGVSADALHRDVQSVMLQMLPTWLGPLLVIAVFINTIAINGMTTYSSSMSLQAIGIPLRRIPAAVVVGIISAGLTVYFALSTTFLDAVNLLLQFLIIVAAPVMAIFVVDVLWRRYRYNGVDLFDEGPSGKFWYTRGWCVPGIAAFVLGMVASAMCLSTDVWSGLVAQGMGQVDLSVPVGIVVAAVVYIGLQRIGLGVRVTAAHAKRIDTPVDQHEA